MIDGEGHAREAGTSLVLRKQLLHYAALRPMSRRSKIRPSGLTFRAGSATNPHDHNRPTGFIRDFNLLVEAASVSASSGLTQDISGGFKCFEANGFKIQKLLTLPIVFEERIAISHVEKIQCHRSSPGKA